MTQPPAPAGFVPDWIIAACAVVHNGKVLIIQRADDCSYPNLWCLPGGKRHPDESMKRATVRELHEETGVTVSEDDLTDAIVLYLTYPDGKCFECHVSCVFLEAEQKVTLSYESKAHQWSELSEILHLDCLGSLTESLHFIEECARPVCGAA